MILVLFVMFLIVLFLCIFFGMNAHNSCQAFWFFKSYTDVPASVLVLIAFACGIVVSLLLVIFMKFKSSSSSSEQKEEKPLENQDYKKGRKTVRNPFSKKNHEPVKDTSDISYKG